MADISKITILDGTTYDIKAYKSLQDESGNNIKATYASSLELSGKSLILKNKNDIALSTVTLPSGLPDVLLFNREKTRHSCRVR